PVNRAARQARCRATNGSDLAQLGTTVTGCSRGRRRITLGLAAEETAVLMNHSLMQGCAPTPGRRNRRRNQATFPEALRLADAGLGFADGALLAQFRAPPRLTGLFVILAFAEFFLNPASLQQLLEPAQGQSDRLSFVNTHPQRHRL